MEALVLSTFSISYFSFPIFHRQEGRLACFGFAFVGSAAHKKQGERLCFSQSAGFLRGKLAEVNAGVTEHTR